MWKFDEDLLDCRERRRERLSAGNIKIELPLPFTGEKSKAFPARPDSKVALRTLLAGSDYDYELVRILPTRLTKATFLLWDSLPAAVQADYTAV